MASPGRKERLVVIGGVAAGMSAASAAKRLNPEMEAIVLEKSPFISYGACSIPYFVSDEIKDYRDLLSLTPEMAERERGITVRTRMEAIAVDATAKQVVAVNHERHEQETFLFDKLVFAMGAVPIRPSFPGVELKNVFTIRTLEDALSVKGFIEGREGLRVVIVGGGYIGLEMCESFRKRGLDVTVIEKLDRVLGTMDTTITDIVEEKLGAEKVKLHKMTTVSAFEGTEGAVRKVVTDKGEVDADLVILAIGVRPDSVLAREAGVVLGVHQAIEVDRHMRTNLTGMYAAGDCADALFLVTGKKAYIPLGTTANKQGRVAGENVAGSETVFDGVVGTAQTKVFDLEVARTGLTSFEAQREGLGYFASTIQGSSRSKAYPAGKPIFITYVVESDTGRLLGAQMVGQEGVAHRIDTLATCLFARMTIDDVARLDLGYAPPFATVWDPILIAANQALKKMGKR